jgi:hypothetical protein
MQFIHRTGGKMALDTPDKQDIVLPENVEFLDTEAPQQVTEKIASPGSQHKHRWWYYLLMVFLLAVLVTLTAWLAYASYTSYVGWYDTQLQKSFVSGKTVGIAVGVQQGAKAQKADDAKVLARLKSFDAHTLAKAKITSYQNGRTDAEIAAHNWWLRNCRYDSVVRIYVCSTAP